MIQLTLFPADADLATETWIKQDEDGELFIVEQDYQQLHRLLRRYGYRIVEMTDAQIYAALEQIVRCQTAGVTPLDPGRPTSS